MVVYVFLVAAALAVVFSLVAIAHKSPVVNVLSLVLVFFSLATIYAVLGMDFLAAIQLVVYSGAVLVLFLFVIMLLDLKAEEMRRVRALGLIGGLISVGAILAIFLTSLLHAPLGAVESPAVQGSTVLLGKLLFTDYLLPFEIVSVLLLVAMVGVVLLSKKDLK